MTIDPVSLAITVALTAANMALTASQTIEGPRVTDLEGTVADYGTPLNYVYGSKRVGAPCFFIEPMKERRKKRKTKGGKYNEYTYYGTWAAVAADHEIAQIKRIWFDSTLIYDIDQGGTVFQLGTGYEFTSKVRFYLGTEAQEPDERMLATIEAQEGADMCPAYLGVAYVFFEDVPLEKLGNRFPQVSAEVSTASSGNGNSFPQLDYDLQAGQSGGGDYNYIKFSPNGEYAILGNSEAGYGFLTFSSTIPITLTQVPMTSLFIGGYQIAYSTAIDDNGTVYLEKGRVEHSMGTGAQRTYVSPDQGRPPNATAIGVDNDVDFHFRLDSVCRCGADDYLVYRRFYALENPGYTLRNLSTGAITTVSNSAIRDFYFFTDGHGDSWAYGMDWDDWWSGDEITMTTMLLYRVLDSGARPSISDTPIITGLPPVSSWDFWGDVAWWNGHLVVHWLGSTIAVVDDTTFAMTDYVDINDILPSGVNNNWVWNYLWSFTQCFDPALGVFYVVEFDPDTFAYKTIYGISFPDFELVSATPISEYTAPSGSTYNDWPWKVGYIAKMQATMAFPKDGWIAGRFEEHISFLMQPTTNIVTLKTIVDDISRRVGLDLTHVLTDAIGTL